MICLCSTNRCLGLNMDMLESDDLFVFNESLDESGEPEIHTVG